MTKAWDVYESTIKDLYRKHTLASVRQIMLEQYNFKASTRAYRQRLDKWGVTKYNTKKRNGHGQDQTSNRSPSVDDANSDPSSPAVSHSGSTGTSLWPTTTAPSGIGGGLPCAGTAWPAGDHQDYPADDHHHNNAVYGSHGPERSSGLAPPSNFNYDNANAWNGHMHPYEYPPNLEHPASGAHNDMAFSSARHHAASYGPVVYPNLGYTGPESHQDMYTSSARASRYHHDDQQWEHGSELDDEKPES